MILGEWHDLMSNGPSYYDAQEIHFMFSIFFPNIMRFLMLIAHLKAMTVFRSFSVCLSCSIIHLDRMKENVFSSKILEG